ncbi:MAG: hypothetical protein KC731_28185 [Myxococcales bacterium]|nr:hypothetical protein [Myxococcales bacterium]
MLGLSRFCAPRSLILAATLGLIACGGGQSGDPTGTSGSGAGGVSGPSGSGAGTTGSGAGTTGSGAAGSGGYTPTGELADDFDGTGPLIGYTTNNESALPEVGRVDGRYRANLVDNANDVTLHYHDAQGRLDAKLVSFPFDVVARNIGIGTQGDSQSAPPPTNNPYVFAGIQVHVPELATPSSSHVVVGHRGDVHFTVEGKNTLDGNSSVNDAGANILPAGRADIRIVGNADHTLTVYWQEPNPSPGSIADDWNLYNGDGNLPGPAPSYPDVVYIGLITYAFGYNGIPFVGTCDAIEGG